MHPLPRTDELAYELDTDPRAVYFEQAAAGVPVRMALIAWLLRERTGAQRPAASDACGYASRRDPRRPAPIPTVSAATKAAYLRPRFARAGGQPRRSCCLRCEFCERELKVEYVGHSRTRRYYRFDESLLGYVRQWIEDGYAGGVRHRQAGRGSGLRALPARSAARNHERRGNRRRGRCVAAQMIRRPARPGARQRWSAWSAAARCWRCACAI